ncbi:MAG TPA: CDP-alcohol phosphatidyltransferase family protein, partial [Alphaproteobacteria bacterium]|nr:CDP-alcohol phosphatidyltransferase family protein [Alphaproteobacteria bacterium]
MPPPSSERGTRGSAAPVINLPNLISLARLAVAPLAVYLVLNQVWALAFWLFVVAGLSDALD